ncbi:hypothetical protein GCM10022408_36500 [Hymenobacter fastidiosus]|uniref:Uncharacterized protein n=1 Tax=Hymenobacter fastidiosus TaxID=486264 RepID=A0ABP7T0B2_9BACT
MLGLLGLLLATLVISLGAIAFTVGHDDTIPLSYDPAAAAPAAVADTTRKPRLTD